MRAPWILYADMVSAGAPLFVAVFQRARSTAARRTMVVWSALLLVSNALALALALGSHNNHWLQYIVTPLAGMLALLALSYWQLSPVVRLWFCLLIPLLAIAWVTLVVLVEDTQTFSLVAESFAALLVLGAATYTLVLRSIRERGSLFQQDWLWIGMGLAVYSGVAIALPPVAHWLLTKSRTLVTRAYEAKAVFESVAQLAIARGVLCPTPAFRSGGSSSRASSRSPSSSSASSSLS